MKRSKLLSLLLVGALSASLVACGSASGSTSGDTANSASTETTDSASSETTDSTGGENSKKPLVWFNRQPSNSSTGELDMTALNFNELNFFSKCHFLIVNVVVNHPFYKNTKKG